MTAAPGITLVAGLGNHGDRYASTRHNVGRWWIERLQQSYPLNFSLESRFNAEIGRLHCDGHSARVMVPNTFVNLSGESIAPAAAYFRVDPAQLLIVHDDLDLPLGACRLKVGGGHGGHNGLRDIIARLGSNAFARLRIGIGHPGPGHDVTRFVLSAPPPAERTQIDEAIDRTLAVLPGILAGQLEPAMKLLHTAPAGSDGH